MKTLRIAIAGLGTVGVGTYKILNKKSELLQKRSGVELTVTAVSARSKKDRGIDLSNVTWMDNAVDLASLDNVDIVLELIGGEAGIAYDLCKQALLNGKHVVTANKALIAHHGIELARIAEEQNVTLAFEAAVAGGIPILKGLKEGLSANSFHNITGILNGTCNYILTEMEKTGNDFPEILTEAKDKGYAEADPTFDIEGIDAAHKLAIITSIAYGTKVNFNDLYVEGITGITIDDIKYAEKLGFKIKLLGLCQKDENGILQRVHPCLVSKSHPISKVDGVFNAVVAQCDEAGKSVYEGRGAGEKPTASSVVADILDIANNRASLPFNQHVAALDEPNLVSMDERVGEYYMRIQVSDKPGVLAKVTTIFSDHNISLRSVIQEEALSDNTAQLILITHNALESELKTALEKINSLDTVLAETYIIRIENL